MVVKSKYGGAPPKCRTLILAHPKEIGLCCNIFLEFSLRHKFFKLYNYCKKVGKKIENFGRRKISLFLLVLFRETYCGVPILKTLIFVQLKVHNDYNRCITDFRNAHLIQIWWNAFTFFVMFFPNLNSLLKGW